MAPTAQPHWAETQPFLTSEKGAVDDLSGPLKAQTPVHTSSTRNAMVVGLVAVAAVTGLVASSTVRGIAQREIASSYHQAQSVSLSAAMGRDEVYDGLHTIMAHNEYTPARGYAGKGYAHLSEGMVVEPHRVTTLQFVLPQGESLDGDKGPMWNVAYTPSGDEGVFGERQSDVEILSSDVQEAIDGTTLVTATAIFEDLGLHMGQITVHLLDGSSYTLTRALYCHYVRRNIRHLTAEEREQYFNAFLTMYHHNTSVGQTLYGGHYRGLRDFVGAHLSAGGTRNADQFHDGMGFLTQHAALTNEFELSIQSIHSHLSVPYWDYTEDGEMVHNARNLEVAWQQDIWGKDWFGNATGASRTVREGRFAYMKAYTSSEEDVVTNPYGYMRSPWNMGKEPFVMRAHKFCDVSFGYESWPFCADHYNITFEVDSWYEWVWSGGYTPHGPIHYYIGGYTNCGDLLSEFEALGLGEAQVKDFAVWMVMLPKNFWRAYVTESPESCSHDAPQTECHMKCMLDYTNKGDVNQFTNMTYNWVKKLSYSRAPVSDANWLRTLTEEQAAGLMKLYCETPFTPGEQIESASPMDPSFWPIHPTMDRLLQYKRMVSDFDLLQWGPSITRSNDDDVTTLFEGYCFQGAGNDDDTIEYMNSSRHHEEFGAWGKIKSLCKGHHPEDMTMFKSIVKDTETGQYVYRATSNQELFQMINPAEYQGSYIYENFEWKHCESPYSFASTAWANITSYTFGNNSL